MAKVHETTVIEGDVLLREKRKWRSRFCAIRRIDSAQALERLQIMFFPDTASARQQKKCETHSLDEFCGLEIGQLLEGELNTLSIITTEATYSISLKSSQEMELWIKALRRECGDEWEFNVRVTQSQMKIRPGEATLRFFPAFFSLTAGTPPQCLGFWMHNQLRRYGGSKGFSFEAGSKCRGGAGMYKLETLEGSRIKELFDRVANGQRLPVPSYTNSKLQRSTSLMEPEISPEHSGTNFSCRPHVQSLPGNLQRSSRCMPDRPPATLPVSSGAASTFPHGGTMDEHSSSTRDYENVTPSDPSYVNFSPAASYTYVQVHRRQLEPEVKYVLVDTQWGSKGDRDAAPQSPTARPFMESSGGHYDKIDIQKTIQLKEALETHQQERIWPGKHS